MYLGKFNKYPFRSVSRSFQHFISQGSANPRCNFIPPCTFPPKTKITIKVSKVPSEELVYRLYYPNFQQMWGYSNKKDFKVSPAVPTGTAHVAYAQFSTPADGTNNIVKRYWGIYGFKFEMVEMGLIINRKKVALNNIRKELKVTHFFSAYRMQTASLGSEATQIKDIWFDKLAGPLKCYIIFAREAEVVFLPKVNSTNLCPSFTYRPKNLESIKLRNAYSDDVYQGAYEINNLQNEAFSELKNRFTYNLANQLLYPRKKHFFERKFTFDSSIGPMGDDGNVEVAHGGVNSTFPINLVGSENARKRGSQISDHGVDLASVFRVELQFKGPCDPAWYMITYFEYLTMAQIDASTQQVQFLYLDLFERSRDSPVE